jgi:hypothetical protein
MRPDRRDHDPLADRYTAKGSNPMRRSCVLFLPLCLLLGAAHVRAEVSIREIVTGRTNWADCLRFSIDGPCVNGLQPGLQVSYNLPHLLLDIVKIPGDSDITDAPVFIPPGLQGPAGELLLPGGGALGNIGEWNLQYEEDHIIQYPLQLAIALHVIPIPPEFLCWEEMQFGFVPLVVHHLSEFDWPAWRLLVKEAGGGRLSVWATLYPRCGFVIHHSPSVASAVFGVRGVHISANPGIHVSVAPLWFSPSIPGDLVQQADPHVSRCIDIGENPLAWDHNMVALNGKYVWIYWHRIACCIVL